MNKISHHLPAVAAVLICAPLLHADNQFSFLADGYTQQLVATSPYDFQSIAGIAATANNTLYTNDGNNFPGTSFLAKWDPTSTVAAHGSTLYTNAASVANSGAGIYWGITADLKGNIYSLGLGGLYQLDPSTLAGTYVGVAGVLGLAYDRFSDSFFSSAETAGIIETKRDGTFRVIQTAGADLDGIAIDPTGTYVAAANQDTDPTKAHVLLYNISTGALSYSFDVNGHVPDGIAFDQGGNIITNNIDGTITELTFGAGGYAAGATDDKLIASGGFFGDLTTVAPDGSFFVSQYGTRYDDGTEDPLSGSVVRITSPSGFVDGGAGGTDLPPSPVPEPSTYGLAGGLLLLTTAVLRRRFKR